MQLDASVDDHVSVLAELLATLEGLAVMEIVGAEGAALTLTITDCMAVPPAPTQLSVNVLLAVSEPVEAVPEIALLPAHAPLAVQLVALVDDQVSVLALPVTTVVGFAASVTVGNVTTVAIADCAAVPPGPMQLRVNVRLEVSGPVDAVPESALLPLHPSLAVQLVAFVDDHVSVLALPAATVVGFTLTVTAGAAITETMVDCVALPPGPVQLNV